MLTSMSGSNRLVAVGLLAMSQSLLGVTPLPVGVLLQHKANYFNLQHQRLRFQPRGDTSYDVAVSPHRRDIDRGRALGKASDSTGQSWRTPLPFPFAFAGKKWSEVYINLNGTLTFGAPEATSYPERETWPDGTMRWLASNFDMGAVAGERRMIAPLWGLNSAEGTRVYASSTRGTFAVTWQAVRYQATNEGYAPLGESLFQVRLSRDGSIEFRYGDVAEKDGITGIFQGGAAMGKLLDALDLPAATKVQPEMDLRRVEVEDRGASVRFLLTFAGMIPSRLASGSMGYGVIAVSQGEGHAMRLTVNAAGVRSDPFCVLTNPRDEITPTDCTAKTLAMASGRTIEMFLPKIALKDPAKFSWKVEI